MNTLRQLIAASCELYADRIAFIDAGTEATLTYRQFDEQSHRYANSLTASGVAPGATVGILMANSVTALVAEAALAKIGATCVPLNFRLSARELGWQLTHSGTQHVIVSDEYLSQASAAAEHVEGDVVLVAGQSPVSQPDPVTSPVAIVDPGAMSSDFSYPGPLTGADAQRLSYTSATTGLPKGVLCPNAHIVDNAATILQNQLADMEPGDAYLAATPLTHMAIGWVWPVLKLGATTVIAPRFRPDEFVEYVERFGITHTLFAPTMVVMLLEQINADGALADRIRSSSLRRIWYAGSGMPPAVARQAEQVLGSILGQQYGFTELWSATPSMCCTYLTPDKHASKLGSCGRPMAGMDVRVVGEDGAPLPVGEVGEITVAASDPIGGYLRDPEQTEATFGSGWVRSGDLGWFDDDGYLHLTDRIKDVIISGGFNVYSAEVEGAISEHPAILECAVVAAADPTWGEVPWAYVTLRQGSSPTEEELIAWVRERLAHYKAPRRFVVLDALPKSHYGKILKRELRDTARGNGEAP